MKFIISLCLFSFAMIGPVHAKTKVLMKTNHGDITLELYDKQAPLTVKNFLQYVDQGFYKDTIFHRVIDNFMIQGGGFTTNLQKKKTAAPVKNEATNRISNTNGTIAMARTSDPHSATGQFFINVKDNNFLDHRNTSTAGFGYCVFGRVIKGMTVVNKIKKMQTRANGPFQNLPMTNVIIQSMARIK